MKRAFTILAVVSLAVFAGGAARAQTAAPAPGVGPVLVGGKSTYAVSFGASINQSATASQDRAPGGTFFIASPGMLCAGTVTITGTSQPLPGNPITSTGQFTFTRTGSPVGCAVTITSSAGGSSATILFQ
jgi:hypothetical protein